MLHPLPYPFHHNGVISTPSFSSKQPPQPPPLYYYGSPYQLTIPSTPYPWGQHDAEVVQRRTHSDSTRPRTSEPSLLYTLQQRVQLVQTSLEQVNKMVQLYRMVRTLGPLFLASSNNNRSSAQ